MFSIYVKKLDQFQVTKNDVNINETINKLHLLNVKDKQT